jgi:SNF2 family DNA or RNA helicase
LKYTQEQQALAVLPLVVYGHPPSARIDEGKLVLLSPPVPVRDEPTERALIMRLRDELNLAPGRLARFEGKEAARFIERARRFEGGVDASGDAIERPPLVPSILLDGDRFEVHFELPSRSPDEGAAGAREARNGIEVDPRAVLRAWQDGQGMVPLDGGGFAPLPADWLSRHGHRLADLLAARREDRTVPTASLPTLGAFCADLGLPPPPSLARLEPLLAGFERIPQTTLPQDLTAELRPYQRRGIDWLCFLRDAELGAVLADDMGLGKTLQALCAVQGRTLVVCPRSVVHNWADEIAKFRPSLRVCTYHGPKRTLDPRADITLTTYAVLRLDSEALAAQTWNTVVLDEAQNIKNAQSQSARAAYDLPAIFRIALSGTPVENRLDELWSLFHFANRGLLGGPSEFQERYAEPISRGDRSAGDRLRAKIRPFLLRRMKREVAPELPPRTEAVLYCELDERERGVYDAVRAATRKEIVEKLDQGGSVLAALEALLRLRQAACHSALLPGQEAESSSKVEQLVEALSDAAADGHKALVFSQWTKLLDRIEPHLENASIPFVRLDGATRDRADVVSRFQAEAGPPVMLISLKAGGTGLNLTAADHVFLVDPWWNPAVEDQAADRAHRIGQDRPVMVYRLVAKDTVEERILDLQRRKRAVAAVALEAGDHGTGLTRDDLMALLA